MRKIPVLALIAGMAACAVQAQPSLTWRTIVNNADLIPGTALTFNSFNQPSVNATGLVVFRARSKGGSGGGGEAQPLSAVEFFAQPSTWSNITADGGPVHGIYTRYVFASGGTGMPIAEVTSRGKTVPQPNNAQINGALSTFEEFPSMPRIDTLTSTIATRGQSQPVYEYQIGIDPVTGLPLTTKVGTSGLYTNPGGVLQTGASLLGAVADFPSGTLTFPYYAVPGAPAGTRFDQFPGAPAVANGTVIAFKGNYTDPTDGLGRTGVYYRDVAANAGKSPVQLVANTATVIPNPPGAPVVTFGSTAPPSAGNGYMVFTGLDIEEAPTRGGIYRAPLQPSPALQTLAGIGDQVPGEAEGVTFNAFGEGLSLSSDARFVSFWGAWGTDKFNRVLMCPADGNAELIAYCQANFPSGYPVAIPVHQGIFVADAQSGRIYAVAKTLADGYTDFLYWVFSGRPPGTGGGDEPTLEPPRWRSSAFAALYGMPGMEVQTAFKATKTGFDGIYVRQGRSLARPLLTIIETQNTMGQAVDPMAPANSIVTAVGVERDGFRYGNLAIAASMLFADPVTPLGWAGLYMTKVAPVPVTPDPPPTPVPTTTTLESSLNPANSGAAVTFTATISGSNPGGSVDFKDAGLSISGCTASPVTGAGNVRTATCTTSNLSAGIHSIVAYYSGDAANQASSSAPLSQTIVDSAPPTTTTLRSFMNPATVGYPVMFYATVNGVAPSGSVNFMDGAVSIAGCAAVPLLRSGNTGFAWCTTATLTIGSHSIVAAYSGDGANAPSTSAPLTQVIK
jgi:Bacterial Ig-like domain (group 3)